MKFVRGGLQMTTIRDCIAPDRNPKVPSIKLPEGSIDTHVHIFESQYPLFEGRGYNPPDSTLDDLKYLHSQLGVSRVVYTQPSPYGVDNSVELEVFVQLRWMFQMIF